MAWETPRNARVDSLTQNPDDPYDLPSPASRHAYRRQPSGLPSLNLLDHVPPSHDGNLAQPSESTEDYGQTRQFGLGLNNLPALPIGASLIKRVPVGSRAQPNTIAFQDAIPGKTYDPYTHIKHVDDYHDALNQPPEWHTPDASTSSNREPGYSHVPSDINLIPHGHAIDGCYACPTSGDVLKSRWTWYTIMLVILAVYSWVFSGVFLVIALVRPRWGHRIGTQGALSYDSATLLSALFSKTVELTFATTIIATLGQILSRRAFVRGSVRGQNSGVSLGELNMRLWIMQPGQLLTHWTGAKYAVRSVLGVFALLAAIATTLYTTSCESLVAPKLKFGPNETMWMTGDVIASYANSIHLREKCATPISLNEDADGGNTCLQIVYAGNGFRNFETWLATWDKRADASLTVEQQRRTPRPPPVSILYENTTVYGQWISPSGENLTIDSERHGRLVQNVTLAMPHANIFHASRQHKNKIIQPGDLQGAGEYYLKAAVPVPALNVLCAGVTTDEISSYIGNKTDPVEVCPLNSDGLSDLFGWECDEKGWRWPPMFDKVPEPFNTVGNTTDSYGAPWVHLLAKAPATTVTSDYVLCSLRAFQYFNCSTAYHAAQSGALLSVHCDNDEQKWESYSSVTPNASGIATDSERNWKDVGMEWIRAIALTHGVNDANASSARLVTQMIPEWVEGESTALDPVKPSIAEALGVLAGNTLLFSSENAPFTPYWDPKPTILEEPKEENFRAILSYQDYSSGPDHRWKGVFYLVLWVTFLMNAFSLLYLLIHFFIDGEVTDYTEPQNLFALAINSPPSRAMAGSCGSGPFGEMLSRKWCVDMSRTDVADQTHPDQHQDRSVPSHPHFFVRQADDDKSPYSTSTNHSSRFSRPNTPRSTGWSTSPLLELRRRSKMPRPKSISDYQNLITGESPAVAQYIALAGR